MVILLIFISCSKSVTPASSELKPVDDNAIEMKAIEKKNERITKAMDFKVARGEARLLEEQKNSDRFKGKLSQKTLNDFLANTEVLKLDKKYKFPFNIVFDKVIAYDYDGDEEHFNTVIKNGKFIPIIDKQAALNKTQVDNIIKTLTSNSTYGGESAACFNPHLGIVFFNESKPVFVVDICLGCNYLTSTVTIPATESHKRTLGNGEKFPIYGFSKSGKQKIKDFAKALNLSYGN